MNFFDQAYDEMSWKEVCYRLPSDLAVRALQRRITNLDTLRMFFENVGSQPASVKPLKEHVNSLVAQEDPKDVMDLFEKDYETTLFNWLDDDNKKRIKNDDADRLSTKFLFNVTGADDKEGLNVLMERVLADSILNQSHLRSILNKADSDIFNTLIDKVLKDSRPEVRVCALGVAGLSNQESLSDFQKTIALKALAKCANPHPVGSISVLNVDVLSNLRPDERLTALERYFNYFPRYRKVAAFNPMPSKEEFDMILFAGCIEHNDRVTKLNETYQLITEADPPEVEDEEEDV